MVPADFQVEHPFLTASDMTDTQQQQQLQRHTSTPHPLRDNLALFRGINNTSLQSLKHHVKTQPKKYRGETQATKTIAALAEDPETDP